MISSDFRLAARRKLDGKWGKAALITLAYAFIFFLLGFIQGLLGEDTFIGQLFNIAQFIINVPLAFGIAISFFKLYNDSEVSAFDFLSSGFSNFKKSWAISLRIALKLIVPIIVLVVGLSLIIAAAITGSAALISTLGASYTFSYAASTLTGSSLVLFIVGFIAMIVADIWIFVKSYYYKLAYIAAIDDENLTAKESVEFSKKIMTGKRGKLFCLELSFIGWAILAVFTFGIGMLWLLPYIQFATIAFYFFVSGKDVNTVETQKVSE